MNYFKCASGTIIEVELEDYVKCVVASEIGNASLEACKAQAIASRTFAVSRGVLEGKAISDSASTAQAYIAARDYYGTCNKAAKETAGEILTYDGKYCTTYFSHSNGGRTYSCKEVWGSDCAYLIARTDNWTKLSGEKKNGHGIGLSQVGAKYAGAHGVGYKEILSFYYPNTKLTQIKIKSEDYSSIVLQLKTQIESAMQKIKEGL